jgi:hypothetical protein
MEMGTHSKWEYPIIRGVQTMVKERTNRGLWIGLLSIQLILVFISHWTYGSIYRVYFGVKIPTPSCPEGITSIHMDPDLRDTCNQERRSIILPSWVAAARLAILGEFLTILGSSVLFWKKVQNGASGSVGLVGWVAVSMIAMLPICCHSLAYWGKTPFLRFLATGDLF